MTEPKRFPEGFLWGAATAAHQVEGGNDNSDWWSFEQEPGRIRGGDTSALAVDHYRRYREDFAVLRRLNHNAHRLSIEWSRVEPAEGQFDSRQIRHYRDVLADLRENGLAPMLTLHHFSSPIWFAGRGGWAASGAPEAFARFVREVVDCVGDLVELWCTINEPNIYAAQGWITGEFPPGRKGDVAGLYRVLANLRQGHELAYAEIKRRLPDAPVGLAQNKWLMLPADPARRRDRMVAALAQRTMDSWPLRGLSMQPVIQASADFIGVNHYTGDLVAFDPMRPGEQFMRRFSPPDKPHSDFGWAIEPAWMRMVLNQVGKATKKPVYITENGIASADDEVRQRFIRDVLEQVHLAIADGVDVRGYFHWTSMDNFEWAQGYAMKFGLIEVDRETLERTPRPSARLYSRIAHANALVD